MVTLVVSVYGYAIMNNYLRGEKGTHSVIAGTYK